MNWATTFLRNRNADARSVPPKDQQRKDRDQVCKQQLPAGNRLHRQRDKPRDKGNEDRGRNQPRRSDRLPRCSIGPLHCLIGSPSEGHDKGRIICNEQTHKSLSLVQALMLRHHNNDRHGFHRLDLYTDL